jgi:hypothetical protein
MRSALLRAGDKRDTLASSVLECSDISCLPNKEMTPHVAQMTRQNPTDPASASAIEGDTKIPDPVNRTQVPVLRKDIMLPSTGHKMKAGGCSEICKSQWPEDGTFCKQSYDTNDHIGLILIAARILIS